MDSLPSEILLDILSRLPIKALLRFRCVNNTCKILSHDPNLPKMHLNRTLIQEDPSLILETGSSLDGFSFFFSENDDDHQINLTKLTVPTDQKKRKITVPITKFRVAGSCNGLVCFVHPICIDPIYIGNPSIGEFVRLPKTISSGTERYVMASGFGFLPQTNTYKVVMIFHYLFSDPYPHSRSEVQIYTLGMGPWRNLGTSPYSLFCQTSSKAFVNGALHWVSDCPDKLIVSFDIAEEQFRIVPRPVFGAVGRCSYHLGLLGGCLSVVDSSFLNRIEIWVMKRYNVMESWSKEYVFKLTRMPKSIGETIRTLSFRRNGEILLLHENAGLVSYDPKMKTYKVIKWLRGSYEVFSHVGSLISANAICGQHVNGKTLK